MSIHENLNKSHYGLQQLSSPLLFQFILMKWIGIHKDLRKLERAAEDLLHIDLKDLENSLSRLIGTTTRPSNMVSWTHSPGHLLTIQEACLYLSNTVKDTSKLLDYIRKTITSCQQAQSCIHHFDEAPSSTNRNELLRPLHRSVNNMQQFATALSRLIFHFKKDENVLFFLLRHASDFDHYFGKTFVRQLLTKLFEGRLKEASQFITNSYKERGFTQLTATILDKIEELDGSLL